VGDFRQQIEALIAYLGLDDAEGVTPENVADWCDYLKQEEKIGKQEEKIGARTVSQKYLAAAKAAFGLAVEKRRLKRNPAADVSVRFTKPKRTRPSGFTDDEARAILTAALAGPETLGRRSNENKRAIRWGPWIFALSRGLASPKSCCCAPTTFLSSRSMAKLGRSSVSRPKPGQ
jgi:site-specific recombinase XerC